MSESSVAWVPDEEGSGCCICHANFSMTLRRHHCRKCGALVCGSCSNNFLKLSSSGASEVRVCDRCAAHLESGAAGESLDVSEQISDSLKQALKEKAHELEQFNSLLLHIMEDQESALPSGPQQLDALKKAIESLCDEFQRESEKYNQIKTDSADLEKEIRLVAQRCLRAEHLTREGLSTVKEIEEYSRRIGLQAKVADQFRERIHRLSGRIPPSAIQQEQQQTQEISRYQVTQLAATESASVCRVLKWLLSFP